MKVVNNSPEISGYVFKLILVRFAPNLYTLARLPQSLQKCVDRIWKGV